MNNPIEIIDTTASNLTEEDIDKIIPDLIDYYSSRIYSLSSYVYGQSQGVALSAFKEVASQMFKKAISTFVFKNQHWRKGRSIGPYLSTCLSRLADTIKSDVDFVKKVSVPVCPACKTLGDKEFLSYEGRMLRCNVCTRETGRLESLATRSSREEYELRIRKVFSFHSRKGHRCPSCERFIPDSFVKASSTERVSCPYDTCSWFGIASELEPMSHPLALSSGMTVSLNSSVSSHQDSSKPQQLQDFFDAGSVNADLQLEQEEKYKKELDVAKSVLSAQKARLKGLPKASNIKKYLMYEAFESILNTDPAAMLSYLIHGKNIAERPIQSLIFQKYIQLIENRLPLEVQDGKETVEAYSLLDPSLNLFLGISEFKAFVRESGFIPNNTHEVFVGAKCNGPCFIGLLCDVKDESGKSLLSEVDYYTFSTIRMKPSIPQGTVVNVIHMRIPPHYEMYSLVNLQRVRRKVVDSIYKRLNGEARPLKGYHDSDKSISEISC